MNQYIDFEVINEPWNKYELPDDGTIIKIKAVLKRIQQVASKDGKLYCDPDTDIETIVVGYSPPSLNTTPGKRNWTPDQLHDSIELDNMPIRIINSDPSEYLIDNGTIIKIGGKLVKVSRTKLHDARGDRIYYTELRFELIATKPDNTV